MAPQIVDFVNQFGLTFDVLHDPEGNIREQYQTTGYPETVIIGRDGVIRRKLIGASDWNSPATRALIERLLDERVSE
jgi:peroxiredoxin